MRIGTLSSQLLKKKKKSGVVEIGYCLNRIAQNLRSEVSSFFFEFLTSLCYTRITMKERKTSHEKN